MQLQIFGLHSCTLRMKWPRILFKRVIACKIINKNIELKKNEEKNEEKK